MSDDGISVIQLIRKGPKCLLRQYGAGWFLPYCIESRSQNTTISDVVAKSLPSELTDGDLAEPLSVLKVNLNEKFILEQVVINCIVGEGIDEAVFERNANYPQKWVSLGQLERAVRADSLVPADVMLGPEPITLFIQSLNNTHSPVNMFVPFSSLKPSTTPVSASNIIVSPS